MSTEDKSNNSNNNTSNSNRTSPVEVELFDEEIPAEQWRRVQQHLERVKRPPVEGTRDLDPVTDKSTVLITARESSRSNAVYHSYSDGEPACRMQSECGWKHRDRDVARQWLKPCQHCHPNGDPDSEDEDETDASDHSLLE